MYVACPRCRVSSAYVVPPTTSLGLVLHTHGISYRMDGVHAVFTELPSVNAAKKGSTVSMVQPPRGRAICVVPLTPIPNVFTHRDLAEE